MTIRPTMKFQYRLRYYLLGRNQVIVGQSTNIDHNENIDIEYENNENSINDGNYIITTTLLRQFNFEEQQVPSVEEVQLDSDCIYLAELEIDGLESITGFIAFKLRHLNLNLGNPSGKKSSTYTWTTQISEGGLYIPTEEFLLQINKLEGIFQEYNKN